jgi:hypothetical protein
MKTLPLVLTLALAAGCARQSVVSREPAAAVTATEEQLAREGASLTAVTSSRRRGNCRRARPLRDNICTLSNRICLLVKRDREIPDGAVRCKKADLRCDSARASVSNVCSNQTARK